MKAYRILEDYVKKNLAMGLNFNGAGTDSWDDLLTGSSKKQQPEQQQAVVQQAKHQEVQKPVQKAPKK